MKPTQTNLQSQTYQAYQAKPTELIKPNQPNLLDQTYRTKPNTTPDLAGLYRSHLFYAYSIRAWFVGSQTASKTLKTIF